MVSATQQLIEIVRGNRESGRGGIASVCTAHPVAIEAALALARERGQLALIEATCNQVNQFGGYTGMQPADFVRLVRDAGGDAAATVLGGDHLGPQPWRNGPAEDAMAKAEVMVANYARAGFTKIHLDCSMRCADDPAMLNEAVIAGRAARLARVAEAARAEGQDICYVIGTEVPPPGGMGAGHAIAPTAPGAVAQTVELHRAAFAAAGVARAFEQVIAVVVQPGVEFGNEEVVHFDARSARPLADAVTALPGLAYEAHSTDYQRPVAYAELVRSHFAILKVGPAATFALREMLFALEGIEAELIDASDRSQLSAALEAAMLDDPSQWQGHYSGDAPTLRYLRRFSFSDRVRYYWSVPRVARSVATLMQNLARPLPLPLLSQYAPHLCEAIRAGAIDATPLGLCRANVRAALVPYADATA
jgi:D-tagatose-1,6-bisphosphate aldolase subunit GatZ/KbaZ